MAEDATPDTSPAAAAGLDPTDLGAGLTDGRVGWIRVEDPDTGGQFDVRSDRLAGLVAAGSTATVVEGYPVHYDQSARDPKPRTDKAGQPTAGEAKPAPREATNTAGGRSVSTTAPAGPAAGADTTTKGR